MSTRPRRQHSGKQQPRIFAYLQYERIFARLLLIWAVVFNLYELAPEVTIRAPMLNDGVMHLLGFQRAVDALAVGQDPTDPWLATIDLGYPLFHFYQHLPFVVPALVYMPLRGLFSTADFFHWTIYLLLSIFPLSIYWSMRRFGFPRLAAAFSGLVASLVSTNGLYGFELGSYVWSGFGLYTQIWGMLLLPPALAQCYTTLRNGNGYFWAVLLLAASTLSHLVFGYIGLVSVVLFTFLPALQWPLRATLAELLWRRIKRLAILLALVGVVTAYFFVPLLQDAAYQNRTVWFPSTFYDSYGYQWVLGTLARGGLFDYNRFPTLTLLAAAGLVVCLRRWRRARYRVPVVLAVVWLLLYFGRSTWGVLMDFLVPMSGNVTLARFIVGVQLGGLYLIGLAIALPWLWAAIRRNYAALALLAGLTALLLFPVYQERVTYLSQNAQWMEQSKTAYEAQQKEVTALVTWLRQAPPGRVYAGLGAQWGRKYTVGAVPVYALLQSAGFDMVGYLYHAESFNADIEVLFDERRQEEYNVFNIRYVVAPKSHAFPAFVRPVKDFGSSRLYEVATTGYFDLGGSSITFTGGKNDVFQAASHWLQSDEPRVRNFPAVVLGGMPADGRHSYPLKQASALIPSGSQSAGPPRGRILGESVADNVYNANIQAQRSSILVLKETYTPNWHATVDGRSVPTMNVMPSYVGIPVTSGTHIVRVEYSSGILHKLLLLVTLLTFAGLAVAEWRLTRLLRGNGDAASSA